MLYKPQTQSLTQASFPLTRSGLKPARPLPKGEVKKKNNLNFAKNIALFPLLGERTKVRGYKEVRLVIGYNK